MLKAAELGNELDKKEFEAALAPLRVDLINMQYDLQQADFSVLVLIVGDDRIGCENLIDRLHEWMDARYLHTHIFERPSDEELDRPRFWRYWRALPPVGRLGIHLGAWALSAMADRIEGRIKQREFETRIDHARRFEQTLAAERTLVLKFFLHLPKKELRKRLRRAEKGRPGGWRVNQRDWRIYERFEEVVPVVEEYLQATDGELARWEVVESTDARYCDFTVARAIADRVRARLDNPPPAATPSPDAAPSPDPPAETRTLLDTVDLGRHLERDDYRRSMESEQERLNKLAHRAFDRGISTVLVFEGWDAGGKGGAIRRITGALPARLYRVIPVAAPGPEEQRYHYLWRFWRHLPAGGRMVIFDRSWYGRVLVERVEELASPEAWGRAFQEINDFEAQMTEDGTVVRKFWLHLDPEEQLRRFKEREKTPYKKYKITEEDFRNRERWADYVTAVNEMVARTHTAGAPWTLVAANDKRWARVEVLRTVNQGLKRALKED